MKKNVRKKIKKNRKIAIAIKEEPCVQGIGLFVKKKSCCKKMFVLIVFFKTDTLAHAF